MTKTTSTTTKPTKAAPKSTKTPKRTTSTPKKTTTKVRAVTAPKKRAVSNLPPKVDDTELLASYQAIRLTFITVNIVFIGSAIYAYANGLTNPLVLLWLVFAEILYFAIKAIVRTRISIEREFTKT